MNESNNNEDDATQTPRARIVVSEDPVVDTAKAAEFAAELLSQIDHEALPDAEDYEAIAEGLGDTAVAKIYGEDVHEELLEDWFAGDTIVAQQLINDSLKQTIQYIDGYLALAATDGGKEPAFSLQEYSTYEANGNIQVWQTVETVLPNTKDDNPIDVHITSIFLPNGIEIIFHGINDVDSATDKKPRSMITIRLPRVDKPPLIYQAGDPLLEKLYTSDETSETSVQPDYMASHEDVVFEEQIAEEDMLSLLTQKMKLVSDLYTPDSSVSTTSLTEQASAVGEEAGNALQLARQSTELADVTNANIPDLQRSLIAMQRYLHSTQVANKHTVEALMSTDDLSVHEIESLFLKTYLAEYVDIPEKGFLPILFNRSFKKLFTLIDERRIDSGRIGILKFHQGSDLVERSLYGKFSDAVPGAEMLQVLQKVKIGTIIDPILELSSIIDHATFSEGRVSLSSCPVSSRELNRHRGYALDSLLMVGGDLIVEYLGDFDKVPTRQDKVLRFLIDGHFELQFVINPSTEEVSHIDIRLVDVSYNLFTDKRGTMHDNYSLSVWGKENIEPICKEFRVVELMAMFDAHQSTLAGARTSR